MYYDVIGLEYDLGVAGAGRVVCRDGNYAFVFLF